MARGTEGTKRRQKRLIGFGGALAVLAVAAAVLLPELASATRSSGVREIRLIARGMSFYVAGNETANPTLRLRAGERVRLVLTNEDAGMNHDFSVKTWEVATTLIEGRGETSVQFRVPDVRGSASYACTPHARMMRGTIEVE